MKKILLFLFLICSILANAQFELDHAYNNANVTRINLEYSGEKYYECRSATNELVLYNADHSFWKMIVLPAPFPTEYIGQSIVHLSESKINVDANLEIIYTSGTSPFEGMVVSEDGTVLLNVPNCQSLYLDEIPGLDNKLVANLRDGSSNVYSVPSLVLEHNYTEGFVRRKQLENSGEKYYLLDKVGHAAKVYNPNHTLWKSIDLLGPPDWDKVLDYLMLTETELNGDSLLKIGFIYYYFTPLATIYTGKIVNENGVVIISIPECNYMYLSVIDGLATKLIASTYYIGWDGSSTTTKIYSTPSLTLEHTYYGTANRTVLENSGEKYYQWQSYGDKFPIDGNVKFYNSNHTLWKDIPLPVNPGTWSIGINFVSETKIASDPLLEIGYCAMSRSGEYDEYEGWVINENGQVYLNTVGAQEYTLSEFPNLGTKLVENLANQVDPSTVNVATNVYIVDPTMVVNEFQKSGSTIAPNPAKNIVNIQSTSAIIEANLFDIRGVAIKHASGLDIKSVPVENLPPGIYLLDLVNANNQKSTHKIIVSH
ncbi:MAG: T9SS type A sorting domain-containing protein [Flavobacterium sp.]|nr:T9SS type A sorting domain-containing protein [Flavobacterium sp.]